MRYACLILSLLATSALAPDRSEEPASGSTTRPATTRPAHATATQPTTGTTTRPTRSPTPQPLENLETKRLVRKLVAELGSPAYRVREGAQEKLAQFGEKAMPYLVEFIGNADPEVSNRIAALIQRPEDPHLRIEVAVRLLATTDPDWMEPAVYMLFDTPCVDYDLFMQRTADASGIERAMFRPVAEQLRTWKRATELFNGRQERLLREQRVGAAKKERELHEGSKLYQAEAAYWSAVEAMEAYGAPQPSKRPPTTQPSGA